MQFLYSSSVLNDINFNTRKPHVRMNSFENAQQALAEQAYIVDFHITRASKLAYMRIQSWKMAATTPGVAKDFLKETETFLQQTLFSSVPNSYILGEEGYYFSHLNN